MFGEYIDLDSDLDICGINRGGGFDDPSDGTDYSFDAQSDATASISDDYLDTFDSENETNEQARAQAIQNENLNAQANATQGQQPEQSEIYQTKKSSSSVYMLALILLLLVAGGLFYYKKNIAPSSVPNGGQEMGDYFYDKAMENAPAQEVETPQAENGDATATENAPAVTEQTNKETMATIDVDLTQAQPKAEEPAKKFGQKSEKAAPKKTMASVVIPVSAGGRLDPFYPFNETQKKVSSGPVFDIVAPPIEIPDMDPMIDKLMEVKITGIMYDNVRPSALIVVDGTEQLAHKGDLISDYKILNITKDKVVMKYKSNIYEVSAGQVLTTNGVNINPVAPSSLSKQFGGAYTSPSKNTIQFN